MLFLAWEFSTHPTDSKSWDRPKSMCARCPAGTVLAASYSKFCGTMAQKRSLGRTLAGEAITLSSKMPNNFFCKVLIFIWLCGSFFFFFSLLFGVFFLFCLFYFYHISLFYYCMCVHFVYSSLSLDLDEPAH